MLFRRKPISSANTAPVPAKDLVELIVSSLDDDKAEDILVIDLVGKTSIADHMVIATGRSQRQVGAMADHLLEALKKSGVRPGAEGMPQCDWVLIDGGDVIVHLFRPDIRTFYNLEKMWSGPSVTTESEPAKRPVVGATV